tara:strand:- start:47 stop:244 length:198 start_codon:yes stop_codon:yes gene_type:complete
MTRHLELLNKIEKLIDDLERDGLMTRAETLESLYDIKNEAIYSNQSINDLIERYNQSGNNPYEFY